MPPWSPITSAAAISAVVAGQRGDDTVADGLAEIRERHAKRDPEWRRPDVGGLRRAIGKADRAETVVVIGTAEVVAARHDRAARRTEPGEHRDRIADADAVGPGRGP